MNNVTAAEALNNPAGVSKRERIPPIALNSTWYKWTSMVGTDSKVKKQQNKSTTCLQTACVVSRRCPEDSAVITSVCYTCVWLSPRPRVYTHFPFPFSCCQNVFVEVFQRPFRVTVSSCAASSCMTVSPVFWTPLPCLIAFPRTDLCKQTTCTFRLWSVCFVESFPPEPW